MGAAVFVKSTGAVKSSAGGPHSCLKVTSKLFYMVNNHFPYSHEKQEL